MKNLVWTTEQPTKEGWYWLKEFNHEYKKYEDLEIVEIFIFKDCGMQAARVLEGISKVSEIIGQWAGPISQPKDHDKWYKKQSK